MGGGGWNEEQINLLVNNKLINRMYTISMRCITHKFLARNYWNIDSKTIKMAQCNHSLSNPSHFSSCAQSERNKILFKNVFRFWFFFLNWSYHKFICDFGRNHTKGNNVQRWIRFEDMINGFLGNDECAHHNSQ